MMSSHEFQELEKRPIREWTSEEKKAYKEDMARQRRIQEMRQKVAAELAEEKRQQELKDLWDWYKSEGVEESFEAQKHAQSLRDNAALKRQIALESAITDTSD